MAKAVVNKIWRTMSHRIGSFENLRGLEIVGRLCVMRTEINVG